MELKSNRMSTPLGEMRLVTDARGTVWSLDFTDAARGAAIPEGAPSPAARDIVAKVQAYFEGELAALSAIPVAPRGDELQRRVWSALHEIPAGTTTSYGVLARSLGFTDPRMAREVGAAIGANPVAVIVPCHRVIGKDGSLRGYRWGIERKRALLAHEAPR